MHAVWKPLPWIVALASLAHAGPRDPDDQRPPALDDSVDAKPTSAQAVDAARAFTRALPDGKPEVISTTLGIPFVMVVGSSGTRPEAIAHCFDRQRYTDEAEGLPGSPDCLARALGEHAGALGKSLSAAKVFATLAALEAKTGARVSKSRGFVDQLVNHQLVHLDAKTPRGPAWAVLTVVLRGGVPVVDGVFAEVPPAAAVVTAKFHGVLLGAPFKADKKFAVSEDGGFKMKKPPAFRGRVPTTATVTVEAGVASELVLRFAAKGAAASNKLGKWFDSVCKSLGQTAERLRPSPLGTPKPGEVWDPVRTTLGRCDAVVKGAWLSARETQVHASDFQNASVEISASVAQPE